MNCILEWLTFCVVHREWFSLRMWFRAVYYKPEWIEQSNPQRSGPRSNIWPAPNSCLLCYSIQLSHTAVAFTLPARWKPLPALCMLTKQTSSLMWGAHRSLCVKWQTALLHHRLVIIRGVSVPWGSLSLPLNSDHDDNPSIWVLHLEPHPWSSYMVYKGP